MKTSKLVTFFSVLILTISMGHPENSYAGGGGGKKKPKTYKWCFYVRNVGNDISGNNPATYDELKIKAYSGWWAFSILAHEVSFNEAEQLNGTRKCFHSKKKEHNLVGILRNDSAEAECDTHNNAKAGTRYVDILSVTRDRGAFKCDI